MRCLLLILSLACCGILTNCGGGGGGGIAHQPPTEAELLNKVIRCQLDGENGGTLELYIGAAPSVRTLVYNGEDMAINEPLIYRASDTISAGAMLIGTQKQVMNQGQKEYYTLMMHFLFNVDNRSGTIVYWDWQSEIDGQSGYIFRYQGTSGTFVIE